MVSLPGLLRPQVPSLFCMLVGTIPAVLPTLASACAQDMQPHNAPPHTCPCMHPLPATSAAHACMRTLPTWMQGHPPSCFYAATAHSATPLCLSIAHALPLRMPTHPVFYPRKCESQLKHASSEGLFPVASSKTTVFDGWFVSYRGSTPPMRVTDTQVNTTSVVRRVGCHEVGGLPMPPRLSRGWLVASIEQLVIFALRALRGQHCQSPASSRERAELGKKAGPREKYTRQGGIDERERPLCRPPSAGLVTIWLRTFP